MTVRTPGPSGPADQDQTVDAEREYARLVEHNLLRNYLAHLAHGLLGQTGFRLLNAPTFLPAYVLLLSGGSDLAVGMILSLQAFGMVLTPLIGANMIEHRRRVLPVGFVTGGAMRAMVLLIALAGLVLEPRWALIAIGVFILAFGLFNGMQGVIFNVLMAKVIPVGKRGRLTGLRNFLAGISSAVVAWIGGEYLIGDTPTVIGYSQIFLLAFVLTSIGLLMLMIVREPQPPSVRERTPLGRRLRQLPRFMREDPPFARYVAARALATMGRMAAPFYILYEGQKIGLSGTTLGVLTVAFTLAGTVSNLIWGALADRHGFRLAFLVSIALWVLSTLLLMVSSGLWITALVFAGIGAAFQGFQQSANNLTLEFGRRDEMPMRIALANTASEMAGTIGPLLGGVLASAFGYTSVFGVSILFLTLGGIMVLRYVPEPRHAIRTP